MTTKDPKEYVENLLAKAEVIETPCGDGSMIWQRWGKATNKPPLVLLHGGYGSWTHWMANVEALSADRLVITCDTPGMGDSELAPGEEAPDDIAKPIVDGLDTVTDGASVIDLAGFSFGGLIGSRVAAMIGEKCRTFVAVGASGFEGLHVRVLGIEVPKREMTSERKNEIHRNNLATLMLYSTDSIDDLAVYTHRKNIARSRVRSRPMSLGNHLADVLPKITARTAGIWGVHDATGGGREDILKRLDIMKQSCPEATMTIIEDAGHWVMYEATDEFNKALLEILDRG